MKAIALGLLVLLSIPSLAFATHRMYVGNTIIEPTDRGVFEEHGTNCPVRHYHGELNGVADPAPDGCGHGEIKRIPHGDGDGETIPPPPAKSKWTQFTEWVGSWFTTENAKNVVDVAAEANGIPPPFQVGELVDITKENAPAIKEKIDNIKEYRETSNPDEDTLGIYNNLDDVPESPTVSQRFFRWFNNLLK